MDTSKLRRFAQFARRSLIEQVSTKLHVVLAVDSAARRENPKAVRELEQQIRSTSREQVVERVAYTWFNRFCALRFMDVNHYTRTGVVSPAPGQFQAEILAEAKMGYVDEDVVPEKRRRQIFALLSGTEPSRDPQAEAYRLLVVAVCNHYHEIMPFLFERIDDYTELLIPDDLLSGSSILAYTREALTPESCKDVEVIGWLYQFYISEKKDAVFASRKQIAAEDLPAVTQLFTPHYIVRYLLENSLGRLWLLNHPNSRLAEHMPYFIRPEQTETNFLQVRSPEELRVGDPAAGSGHMLTYAFDLLYLIYEEQGYNPRDIARRILEHNLFGMEIDDRAGALAAFALTMKAREKDSRFFRRGVRPNIMVLRSIEFSDGEFRPLLDGIVEVLFQQAEASEAARPQIREALLHDLHLWAEADNFGSLLRPQLSVEQIAAVRAHVAAVAARPQADLVVEELRGRLLRALAQAEALARSYHVVVANPPYMGSANMNVALSQFAQANYPDSKADLFAMFIERNLELVRPRGLVAMITMQSWMFLSSYEKLRSSLLDRRTIKSMAHLGARAFDTVGGEVVSTTAFVVERAKRPTYKGSFLRMVNGNSEAKKEAHLRANLPSADRPLPDDYFLASTADFRQIPGTPIAYWVSEKIRSLFLNKSFDEIAIPKFGMSVGDGARFIRLWYEVNDSTIGDGFDNENAFSLEGFKWAPLDKGGPYRKWYGNKSHVVLWENKGEEIRNFPRSAVRSPDLFFKPRFSWTLVSSDAFSARYFEKGYIIDTASNCIYFHGNKPNWSLLAFFNSKLAQQLLGILNPTINFSCGVIGNLPALEDQKDSKLIECLLDHTRFDWDAFETSRDFSELPLLRQGFRCEVLDVTYTVLRVNWRDMSLEMQRFEEENNRIFIDAYGLHDELTPDVPLSEITLTCNPWYRYGGQTVVNSEQWAVISERWPEVAAQLAQIAEEMAPQEPEERRLGLEQRLLADTIRELISYAVGCMFGRYSLHKPGLILANQGETVEDFVRKVAGGKLQVAGGDAGGSPITFMPDRDNAIPILDGEWFEDDIVGRFRAFLRAAFGEERLAENLAFVEAALGRDVRSYFLREFYDDHLKRYKKRPIYWLFSSAKGSFNVLIYMHRYRPDTVSVVLNGYLREFQAKLRARRGHLQPLSISPAATPRDRANALKEIDRLDKTLAELAQYEDEVLYPLAAQRLEIDLDDGVKVNYARFGAALKQVAGLSA